MHLIIRVYSIYYTNKLIMGGCNRKPEVIESNSRKDQIQNQNNKNTVKDNKTPASNVESSKSSQYNTPNREFLRGELIANGKIGDTYSGLSVDSGKIVVIKHIDFSKFDTINILVSKNNLVKEYERLNGVDKLNQNLNNYIAYQIIPEEENSKCLIINLLIYYL